MSLLSIGKAWDETKSALQANRKLIVPVALGLILLPAVVVSMVEPRVPAGEQPPPGAWMLIALVMVIVMIVGQLAIVLMVNGWRGSVGEAIGKAARRTPTFVLAALAYLVPVIILFSVLLGVAGIGTTATGQVDLNSFNSAGWLVLLLFLLVLVFVSIRLLPLLAVVASEEIGPIASLKRSFALTSGHFWRLLGFLMLFIIAAIVVLGAVGIFAGLVGALAGGVERFSVGALITALLTALASAVVTTVYIVMVTRIYVQVSGRGSASVPKSGT